MKYVLIISLVTILNFLNLHSQDSCYTCPPSQTDSISYTVNQPNCGICTYTVYYEEGCPGTFIIREIRASSSNPPCCQGTAINDPIVSGYILDEAANQIAQQNGGTAIIYTPSRCWQWYGHLGPGPLHQAVLIPCGTAISCCKFTYNNGVLKKREAFGEEDCYNSGCFQLCAD